MAGALIPHGEQEGISKELALCGQLGLPYNPQASDLWSVGFTLLIWETETKKYLPC